MSDPVSLNFCQLTAALASLRPFARAGSALVGSSGLEPPTSRLSGARSNLLSYEPMYDRGDSCAFSPRRGGDDGIRTHDPLLAGQVLSQLSYTPIGVTLVSRVVQFLSKTILFDSP